MGSVLRRDSSVKQARTMLDPQAMEALEREQRKRLRQAIRDGKLHPDLLINRHQAENWRGRYGASFVEGLTIVSVTVDQYRAMHPHWEPPTGVNGVMQALRLHDEFWIEWGGDLAIARKTDRERYP